MDPPAPSSPRVAAECAVVALGAVAGATARWGAGELVAARPSGFPLATVLVNVAGCLLAGFAAARLRRGSLGWLCLVTGALGGFTTFSTFAVDTRLLLGDRWPVALACIAASLGGGVAATSVARRAAA